MLIIATTNSCRLVLFAGGRRSLVTKNLAKLSDACIAEAVFKRPIFRGVSPNQIHRKLLTTMRGCGGAALRLHYVWPQVSLPQSAIDTATRYETNRCIFLLCLAHASQGLGPLWRYSRKPHQ